MDVSKDLLSALGLDCGQGGVHSGDDTREYGGGVDHLNRRGFYERIKRSGSYQAVGIPNEIRRQRPRLRSVRDQTRPAVRYQTILYSVLFLCDLLT